MTAGMAFEALNHVADVEPNLLVILNDNAMSISRNVGGLAKYFARILASRTYLSMRQGSKKILSRIPRVWELAKRTEEHMKGMVVPGTLFDELGLNYIGPIDGHDLKSLVQILENIKDQPGPQFLHVVTQKGKGYGPAEASPVGTHSMSKIEAGSPKTKARKLPSYSNIFGEWACDIAKANPDMVAITPAMKEGSDLVRFAEEFPDRYYDVAIAEQHAVTLAAGLACEGIKPVVAIYSTFLQRGYDQLIHDVAIQNLDVLFAIDRSGLLEDGPTHSGAFDLSFLRCIPNLIIMAPSDENEAYQMLSTGYQHTGPAAVRYGRGAGPGIVPDKALAPLNIGEARVLREGREIAILAFGSMVNTAMAAAERLDATLVDMRFVKPLDEALIRSLTETHQGLVTIEENALNGGAGSGVNEFLARENIQVPMLNLGIPDEFISHAKPAEMLAACGLSENGIYEAIQNRYGLKEVVRLGSR